MRLAVCALSAVLLSGCSWLGGGLGTAGQSGFFGNLHSLTEIMALRAAIFLARSKIHA